MIYSIRPNNKIGVWAPAQKVLPVTMSPWNHPSTGFLCTSEPFWLLPTLWFAPIPPHWCSFPGYRLSHPDGAFISFFAANTLFHTPEGVVIDQRKSVEKRHSGHPTLSYNSPVHQIFCDYSEHFGLGLWLSLLPGSGICFVSQNVRLPYIS